MLLCCYLYTVLYLEHRDCRPRRSTNIASIAAVILRYVVAESCSINRTATASNRRLRSSFPRYASRDRALASEITISNLRLPPGTFHLLSSPLSSPPKPTVSANTRTHTACKIVFASLLT